ncbi:outer membrane beta-barrel protein [Mucilaginibacter sp. HD30]
MNNAKSTDFAGGVTLEIVPPGNNYKWSIINELMYTSYTMAVHKTTYKSADIYSDDDVKFGVGFVKLNNMLRVKFPINDASIFLNGGFSNGVVFSPVNNVKSISTFYSTTTTTEGPLAKESLIRKFESGILFGVGAGFGRYAVQARGEINSSATDDGAHANTKKGYLLLSYKF